MSVRIVRTRNGEDVICDIREITKEGDEESRILGYQMINPYLVYISEGMSAEDDEGNIHKLTNPEITMEPWMPLAKDKERIIIRFDEIISAYETHDDVTQKYTELVGATNGVEPRNDSGATGGTSGTNGSIGDASVSGETDSTEGTE